MKKKVWRGCNGSSEIVMSGKATRFDFLGWSLKQFVLVMSREPAPPKESQVEPDSVMQFYTAHIPDI